MSVDVSIIVPVYNRETKILDCIHSLQAQTYKKLEIVIVDDGSQDSSGERCDALASMDQRIKVIHKSNGGVSSARNVGIQKASGKYLMFLDSDDVYEPETVEAMMKYAKDETLCLCGIRKISQGKSKDYLYDERDVTEYTSQYYFDMDRKGIFYSVCNKLYVKDILVNEAISFDETVHYTEDFIFNLQYFQHIKKVIILNKAYYHYIDCDKHSLSKANIENILHGTKATHQHIYDYLKANPNIPKTLQASCMHSFVVNLLSCVDRSQPFFRVNNEAVTQLITPAMKELRMMLPYANTKTKIEYWLLKHRMFRVDRMLRTLYFKMNS